MPTRLSKLHVRFIQTQKHFSLHARSGARYDKLGMQQLYIKDNGSFYFANFDDRIHDGEALVMLFKTPNDYLAKLQCDVTARVIGKGSETYDDALLFFQLREADVKQLLLLSVVAVEEQ